MALKNISVSREETMGAGPGGEYYLGDALALIDELQEKYLGQVKCVYLDPPFLTGQSFEMNVRVGEVCPVQCACIPLMTVRSPKSIII